MSKKASHSDAEQPIIDQVGRSSDIGRLLLLGIALVAIAGAFVYLPQQFAQPAILITLGLLAMVGVFFLFALALGIVHLTARSKRIEFARTFLDGLESGTLVSDHEGRILYANKAYAELTGADNPADVPTVERAFSHDDEASETVYKLSQAVRSGEQQQREFRMMSGLPQKDGDQPGAGRWYRLKVRPLVLPEYSKPLHVWQVSDISKEREGQEKVFLDLQYAIDYLDHAPAGFFSADADGTIVYLNATLADWLGIDLTQFIVGQLRIQDLVLGDGMALLNSVSGTSNESKTAIVDLDLARSNGQSLAVRLYHKVPVNRDGAPGATRTLVLNRSQGEDSAEELRAAEVRFTRFFNNTPIAIASVAAEGAIVKTNAPFQKLFQPVVAAHKSDEPLNVFQLVHERDQKAFGDAIEDAKAGKGNIKFVDTVLPEDEDCAVRFYVGAIAEAERDDDGEVAICYALEITEQRALEAQMAQSQKMQAVGQLAGGIAHDFNNVLTAIIGFSDLLLANHRASDPSFPDIMNIKQNANRAASLVRQLLAFSRRQTLRPQALSLPDVLADLRMLLDRLVGDKVKLTMVHGRDLWPLKADIGQLEQVIVNLCVNARDAMPEGGELTIQTSNMLPSELKGEHYHKEMPAREYVLIEIIDDGTGMTAEVQAQIFEPFFSTKEVGEGTGLGLSTVYGIIKQSGGFIYPHSALGEGTNFRVYLPRHIPTAKELAAEAEDKLPVAAEKATDLSGSATILLVEDEDAVRAFGARALQSRGYTVFEAESGVEALEVIEEYDGEFDLVVSDVVMPEMDGPTLLVELRKTHKDLKFIFVSGYAEDAFAKNLPEEERDKFGFLPKPFSLKQLASTVKEMLEK